MAAPEGTWELYYECEPADAPPLDARITLRAGHWVRVLRVVRVAADRRAVWAEEVDEPPQEGGLWDC